MENILGISIILTCICLCFFAWHSFTKKGYFKTSLTLLILCGFLLRIFVSGDLYLHKWDERYHAVVAKNLIKHPLKPTLYDNPVLDYDYKDWGRNHIWLHKQPIPLWTMALSMYIFGVNEIALRIPSILLSTIAIFLTFKIGALLFGNRVGLLAAFLHAIHGLTLEVTGGRVATDHIDLFFLFFIELAVYFALLHSTIKKDWKLLILIGLSTGLAILCKWLPALIVLPIWLLLNNFFKSKAPVKILIDISIVALTIAIIVVPWQIYTHTTFPLESLWESNHQVKHIFENLDGNGQPFYYHLNRIRIIFGELIYLPLLWWIFKSLKKAISSNKYTWLALTIWIIVPLIFFSFVKTKMQAYLLFTAPALFIITAFFWQYLNSIKSKFGNKKIIISFVSFLLLALPVRYSIERVNPFCKKEKNPAWVSQLKSLDNKNPTNETIVVFNVERFIEAMFYNNTIIPYPDQPNQEKINLVLQKGYKPFLLNDEGLLIELGKD